MFSRILRRNSPLAALRSHGRLHPGRSTGCSNIRTHWRCRYAYFLFTQIPTMVGLIFELHRQSLVRFVYWAVDPIWARSLIPPNVHTPIRTWSLPLSLSALLVLVFFWHETASSTSLRFSWSIERFKIPCYLIVISLFVLEISSNILYFMGGDISARAFTSYALPIIYILVGLGIASFLLVTSARIVLRLQKAVKSQNADDKFTHDSIRIRPVCSNTLLPPFSRN